MPRWAKAMPAHEFEQVWHSCCPCFILKEYIPLTRYLEMTQLRLCRSNKTTLPGSPTRKRAEAPSPLPVLEPKATDHPGQPLLSFLSTCYAPHRVRWCRNPVQRQAGPLRCWEVLSVPLASRLGLPKTRVKPSSICPLANICIVQRTEIRLDCLPSVGRDPAGKGRGALHSTQQSRQGAL